MRRIAKHQITGVQWLDRHITKVPTRVQLDNRSKVNELHNIIGQLPSQFAVLLVVIPFARAQTRECLTNLWLKKQA